LKKSTVSGFHYNYLQHGFRHVRSNCGRHRVTTAITDRMIIDYTKDYPFKSLTSIRRHLQASLGVTQGRIPSLCTIGRRLIKIGRRSHPPASKCALTDINKLSRYMWGRDHLQWNEEWKNVVFTDESTFQLQANSCQYVRRPLGKRFSHKYVHQHLNRSVACQNVWVAISWNGVSEIHFINGRLNGQKYVNEILKVSLAQYCNTFFHNQHYILQQDNCPCHTATITKNYFSNQNIEVLDWPSVSPDLNPLENVWADAKRQLSMVPNVHDVATLRQELINIFVKYNTTRSFVVKNAISSMHRRCKILVDVDGEHLKY
jgi:hypothetical protein